MDIRKLQRAIVDGLEDVKAQNIVVFNTEHLSPLFERVIIASGTSNRQTKALASSVRDSVKGSGFPVMRTEGEDNGEWIIVDCGAAVAHIMQPAIRDYYHLEEIWGSKPVRLKLTGETKGLPKASGGASEDEAPSRRRGSRDASGSGEPAAGVASTKTGRGAKTGAKSSGKALKPTAAADRAGVDKKAAGESAPATKKRPARKTAAGKTIGGKPAGAKTAVKKAAVTRKVGVKSASTAGAAAKAPATKRARA